jgi:hypothetical protein
MTIQRLMAAAAVAAVAAVATWPLLSTAQPVGPAHRPDPADAATPVPPIQHRSLLSAYRGAEHRVGNWREANDNVARAGGWRAYLKEAQQQQAEPPQAPASAAAHPHH